MSIILENCETNTTTTADRTQLKMKSIRRVKTTNNLPSAEQGTKAKSSSSQRKRSSWSSANETSTRSLCPEYGIRDWDYPRCCSKEQPVQIQSKSRRNRGKEKKKSRDVYKVVTYEDVMGVRPGHSNRKFSWMRIRSALNFD